MAKAAKKTKEKFDKNKKFKLDMSFDEAIKKLANPTAKPKTKK